MPIQNGDSVYRKKTGDRLIFTPSIYIRGSKRKDFFSISHTKNECSCVQ